MVRHAPLTRVQDVLDALGDDYDYYKVINVVYAFYLTERQREQYQALLLYAQGKPQRDIGIVMGTNQCKVSWMLSRLRIRLKNIVTSLYEERERLDELLCTLEKSTTRKQFAIVCYLLAGHRRTRVAHSLHCTPAHITQVIKKIAGREQKHVMETLTHFLLKLG